MISLEGANCADLPGFVIDKYFDCDAGNQPLRARVALAICANCAVQLACRDQAMAMVRPPPRGIIGGVTASQLHNARAWRRYEIGERDQAPPKPRPTWLEMSEAAQIVEQWRTESDPDESEVEP